MSAQLIPPQLIPPENRPSKGGLPGAVTYYADYRTTKIPYNAALGAVILPSLSVLLIVGGKAMLGAVAAMFLLGYLLELLKLKEGSLVAMWFALIWVAYSFTGAGLSLVRHTFSNMFLLLHGSCLIISVAMWISIQYEWFQTLLPGATVLFERLLFSVTGVNATAVLSWALVVVFGVQGAPFYVLVVQHIVFTILGVPRFTAFRKRREGNPDLHYYIQAFPEAASLLSLYLLLPVGVHLSLYHSATWDRLQVSNLLLLIAGPLLGVWWMWPYKPLWYLERFQGVYQGVQRAALLVPAALLPLGMAWRVLIPVYMADMALPPPLGDLVVIGSLYAVVIAVALHRTEWVSTRFAPLVHGTAAVATLGVCAFLVAPLLLWPIANLCSQSLVWFYFQRKRRGAAYAAFVGSAVVCLVWFFNAKLSFLAFHFARIDLPLNNVLGLLACVFLAAFALLYLMVSRAARPEVVEAALVVYSCAFALAEWILAFGHGEVAVYPEWLVLGTSVGGVYFCRSAMRLQLVSRGGAWASACVWLAKVGPLVCPAQDAPVAVLATLLILWTAAPIAFYWSAPHGMRSGQALVHAALVGIAWLFAASTSLPQCHMSLLFGTPPDLDNPMLFYGGAIFMWGLTLLFMSQRYFPARTVARSVSLLIMLTGLLLVALQPSTSILGGVLLLDDGDSAVSPFALWGLGAFVIIMSCPFIFPGLRSAIEGSPWMRFVHGCLVGCFASLYFNASFVTPEGLNVLDNELSGLLFATSITTALILSAQGALHLAVPPKEPPALYLATRFLLGSSLFPVCYGLAAVALPGLLEARSLTAVRVALLTLHCALLFALALVLTMQRIRAAARGVSSSSSSKLSVADRDVKLTVSAKPRIMGQTDPDTRERLLVSNAATVCCLVACYALGALYIEASAVSLLPLCTILMLYSSPLWISPYLLPLSFGTLSLVGSVAWHIFFGELHLSTFGVLKNLILLAGSGPSFFFIIKGLVTYAKRDIFSLLLSCPIPCLLGIVGDVVPDVYVLAAFSFFGTLFCVFSRRVAGVPSSSSSSSLATSATLRRNDKMFI